MPTKLKETEPMQGNACQAKQIATSPHRKTKPTKRHKLLAPIDPNAVTISSLENDHQIHHVQLASTCDPKHYRNQSFCQKKTKLGQIFAPRIWARFWPPSRVNTVFNMCQILGPNFGPLLGQKSGPKNGHAFSGNLPPRIPRIRPTKIQETRTNFCDQNLGTILALELKNFGNHLFQKSDSKN